eukprot:762949-Hanusia_phi.AAC.3
MTDERQGGGVEMESEESDGGLMMGGEDGEDGESEGGYSDMDFDEEEDEKQVKTKSRGDAEQEMMREIEADLHSDDSGRRRGRLGAEADCCCRHRAQQRAHVWQAEE